MFELKEPTAATVTSVTPRSDRWIDQITSEGGRGLTRMVAFLRRGAA